MSSTDDVARMDQALLAIDDAAIWLSALAQTDALAPGVAVICRKQAEALRRALAYLRGNEASSGERWI